MKMERKIRWMVMHSQVPGCFPATAGLCCPPNNAIHATPAEAGQGERLRGGEGASTGPRARCPRRKPVWGAGVLSRVVCCPGSHAPAAALTTKITRALVFLGEGWLCSGAWRTVGSRLFLVSTRGSLCPHPCIRLRMGPEDTWWDWAP